MARGPTISSKEEITRITVSGFKSIVQEQSIDIKPLTILAGANSSGKSSIMQPLLLLKQTLDSTYDPGPLLLNGPNIKFTASEQLLSRAHNGKPINTFHVGIAISNGSALKTSFKQNTRIGFELEETTYSDSSGENFRLFMGMPQDEIQLVYARAYGKLSLLDKATSVNPIIVQDRCFLELDVGVEGEDFFVPIRLIRGEQALEDSILRIIHLPGLRGSPERDFPVAAIGRTFPGTFEYYAASVIEKWQVEKESEKLKGLNSDLARLALTRKVIARRKNAIAIELLVDRFLEGDKEDMVSIADVGLGVSQALPVVVALHTAAPGQLVYIDQSEIHLHPRAQSIMAEVLADAVLQGKRVVVETHSGLLLRGVQILVAEGKLSPELVKLHWFKRLADGSTEITSADLDERGAYGDWPEDFDDVLLNSEGRYIDAVEDKMWEGN